MTYYSTPPGPDELYHHGIKGMKWGVRRWQNEDGSLTAAGERHYYRKERNAYIKDLNNQMARKKKVETNNISKPTPSSVSRSTFKNNYEKKLDKVYGDKEKELVVVKDFADKWFKDNDRLTSKDISKLVGQHYNAEHNEYRDNWAGDVLLTRLDDLGYNSGFDNGTFYFTKRR